MAVRDPSAAVVADVLADLRATVGAGVEARLELVALDLADLASVRRAAAAVLSRHTELHLLINNAGAHTHDRARPPNLPCWTRLL